MVEPMVDSVNAEVVNEIEKVDDEKYSFASSDDDGVDDYIMAHSSGKNRLFGRQKPLHLVLGGGKPADIMLWRNKKVSGRIVGGVTVVWIMFEWVGYHFLTLVCHSLILSLATFFIWSNLASFINVSPPEFPEIVVPEDLLVTVLLSVKREVNCALATFREVAAGKDLKKFLLVTIALWIVSVIGSWFSFLTLCYLLFVMVATVPVLYEKNEDVVDSYAEKAWIEIKKQHAVLDEKYLHKIPMLASLKGNKQH